MASGPSEGPGAKMPIRGIFGLLLPARHQRPRRRSTEPRDELAPSHYESPRRRGRVAAGGIDRARAPLQPLR